MWAQRIVALGLALAFVAAPGMALAKRTFVYAHDRVDGGGIFGFELDPEGGLTPLPGSPTAHPDTALATCIDNCQTLAYSAKRKTLYAGGDTGISAWTVSEDGFLTSLGGPFVPSGGGEFLGTGVVEAGKRTFVYSTSFDDAVYGFEAAKDGALTEIGAFAAGTGPVGLATRKKFVFVANGGDGSISSYVAGKDGTLHESPGSPLSPPVLLSIFNVDPDPRGKFLYVADDIGAVHSFKVDKKTGALDEVPDSPFFTQSLGFKNGAIVTKKLLWAIDAGVTSDAMQPFFTSRRGSLSITGITIDTPLIISAHTADARAKRVVLVGPAAIVVGALVKGETNGFLEGIGSATFPYFINPNAVVMVKR